MNIEPVHPKHQWFKLIIYDSYGDFTPVNIICILFVFIILSILFLSLCRKYNITDNNENNTFYYDLKQFGEPKNIKNFGKHVSN